MKKALVHTLISILIAGCSNLSPKDYFGTSFNNEKVISKACYRYGDRESLVQAKETLSKILQKQASEAIKVNISSIDKSFLHESGSDIRKEYSSLISSLSSETLQKSTTHFTTFQKQNTLCAELSAEYQDDNIQDTFKEESLRIYKRYKEYKQLKALLEKSTLDYSDNEIEQLKALQKNWPEASFLLGYMYEQRHQFDIALTYYHRGSSQQHLPSIINKASLLIQLGKDSETPKEFYKYTQEGLSLLEKAAEKGSTVAALNLGLIHLTDDYIRRNEATGFQWILSAATQGDSNAQFKVATMYAKGLGIQMNEKQAIYWLNKSANGGHPLAKQFLLD